MIKSSPGVSPKPRFGPNLDSMVLPAWPAASAPLNLTLTDQRCYAGIPGGGVIMISAMIRMILTCIA